MLHAHGRGRFIGFKGSKEENQRRNDPNPNPNPNPNPDPDALTLTLTLTLNPKRVGCAECGSLVHSRIRSNSVHAGDEMRAVRDVIVACSLRSCKYVPSLRCSTA